MRTASDWTTKALADLAIVSAGQGAPQDHSDFAETGTPFIRAGSLDALVSGGSEDDCERVPEKTANKYRLRLFPAETILFAKSGMSAKKGRVYKLRRPAYVTNHLAAIIPTGRIEPDYLFRWLSAFPPTHLIPNDSYPSIRLGEVEQLKITLPTTSKGQKRIAAILDKADAIRAKRREALVHTGALLRATFFDMFGDLVANPKAWDTRLIAEIIADGPQNGLYRHSSEYGSGTPILRIDSFYDGRTKKLSSLKRVRIDEDTLGRWSLRADDIVINRVNSLEYLGKSAIIPPLTEPTVFESNMMRFAADRSIVEPGFLIDQLQTDHVRRQIRKRARPAVNQSSINQDDVRSIEVRVPPIDLQKAYVTAAKRIEAFGRVARTALSDADALCATISQRAFRGEL